MLVVRYIILIILCISAACAYAFAPFTVKKITVTGLQRISEQTVVSDLPIKAGQQLTPKLSNKIIDDLFSSGYFSNIELFNTANNGLLIKVVELPTIAKVKIHGNSDIKTKQLKQVLQQAGIQAGNMLDATTLKQVKQSLEEAYYNLGKYAVKISVKVTKASNNRVNLNVDISEGISTKISRITFIGNKTFSDETLTDHLALSTPTLLSFFTGKDVYSKQKLDASLANLSKFYMDNGFLDFRVDSAIVTLSPDHNKTFLSIGVNEGQKYTFKGYKLAGTLILQRSELEKLIKIKAKETFSRQVVLDAAKAITTKLADRGYAFANVNPVPTIDKKKHSVEITFYINPGKQVYVNQISFSGNHVTNDQVLRQQMRFVEGSKFNLTDVNSSKTYIRRAYPFITEISDTLKPIPGKDDQVNVNYKVKERSANTVTAGIGFSDLDGVILNGNLNMPNLFGTGNIFNINASVSKPAKSLNFSYTEPYFTMDGVSQNYGLYLTNVDNAERNLTDYSTNSVGGYLNYSVPIAGTDSINFGGGVDYTDLLQPQDNTSDTVKEFIKEHNSSFTTFTVNLGWSHNSTDRAWFPTKGLQTNLDTKVAVPGSNLTWYKLLTSATWYHPVWGNTYMSIGGHVNYGNGYGGNSQLPMFNNFYAGGWGSVRGYAAGSLGPKDTLNDDPNQVGQSLGGNLEVDASLNYYFPVPFTKNNPNFRMGVFADMGNVYSTYRINTDYKPHELPNTPNFSNMRYSVGLSFQWISPLGPLSFSLAKALNNKPGDDTSFFQFSLGQTF